MLTALRRLLYSVFDSSFPLVLRRKILTRDLRSAHIVLMLVAVVSYRRWVGGWVGELVH
jgi:hypothetical protein